MALTNAEKNGNQAKQEGMTMTRKDIETQYKVVNGRICSPGCFEGEMVYVPHFWDIFMNGFADRDDGDVLGFDVTPEDKVEFPELRKRKTVKLYQRDDGFICEC